MDELHLLRRQGAERLVTARPPRVTVCIPTYNQARFLGAAIESVRRQTFQDFEIVVSDDASTDGTAQVVQSVADPRVRYFRQSRNLGIAGSRNRCLRTARGDYVAWLDSDDVYRPEMLARQVAVLDRHRSVGLVHGAYEIIDDKGRRLPDWPLPFSRDVIEPGRDAFRELILGNYIGAPTVMIRRALYHTIGLYAPQLRTSSEDWEMWLRVALYADIAYTAATVAQYRFHADSASATATRGRERLRMDRLAVRRVFSRHRALIPDAYQLERQAKAALAAKALLHAGSSFSMGRRGPSLAAALMAVRLVPSLLGGKNSGMLLLSTVFGDEYRHYGISKALLGRLHAELAGTRYGSRLEKVAVVSPVWRRTLAEIAETVNSLVPVGARVAAIDKWDPTLLHLSGRRGWHFPDRRLLPAGYPRDSSGAIHHLQDLIERGARYLVIPCSAFWWLEHYVDFHRYLNHGHTPRWADKRCVIYELDGGDGTAVPG